MKRANIRRCGLLAGRDRLHSARSGTGAAPGCGLLAGRDRLHSSRRRRSRRSCCGLLAGRDRLHSSAARAGRRGVADCSQVGIDYTSRLKWKRGCRLRIARRSGSITLMSNATTPQPRCGLLAGRDRLHSMAAIVELLRVADCSQVGIDYTGCPGPGPPRRVADCSQVGIDYTLRQRQIDGCLLRIARRSGSITLLCDGYISLVPLRIARRSGSITLLHVMMMILQQLRIARRSGSITLIPPAAVPPKLLRIARRSGSITLVAQPDRVASELRIARRSGSITLLIPTASPWTSCGLLAGRDRLHWPV